jgi:hypothetical protein
VWSDREVAITRKATELTPQYVTADYQFEELGGATHWLPNEQPAEIADIIIRRTGLGAA